MKRQAIQNIICLFFLLSIEETHTFSPAHQRLPFQHRRRRRRRLGSRTTSPPPPPPSSSSLLFASPTTKTTGEGEQKRKKKKNKYAKFSKADKVEKDPFEKLLEESEEKMERLKGEKEQRRAKQVVVSTQEVEATKRLEFPNNKDIDPYDPTTFGYIEIGTIQGPHGVHGWAKVQGVTDYPERLTTSGMLLHMKPFRKRAPRRVTLAAGKMTGTDSFLIQLQGIYDRTEAQKLKGATLYYATQQDTCVKEDDILISDLVGLDVYTQNGDILVGSVDGVVLAEEMCAIPGLGQDMLEVSKKREVGTDNMRTNGRRPPPKDLVLIPLVPEIVPKIDLVEKKISIVPPEGLLDLTYVREEKVQIKGLLPPAKD